MSFVSYSYFAFLAICLMLYYILPHRVRWFILLSASIVFCMSMNIYSTVWLLVTTVITYVVALLVEKSKEKRIAQIWLWLGLILSFGALAVVKYSSLVFVHFPNSEGEIMSIAMPVGISFYIFQVTGYLLDVYWKKIEAVKHFGHYALAVTFFGKFTQGPIAPVESLVPQFRNRVYIDIEKMRYGCATILLGLFKKVVVADRLAVLVNEVFAVPSEANALSALLGIIFYSFQLYTDFAGYTDIALGSAMLFGIELPQNFNQPYMARSIGEFWRRWHMSLSTWLRKYVYIPLGGSRVSKARWAFNTLVVFFVSGLWHGTGMTFVLWGMLHGIYQIIGRYTKEFRNKIKECTLGSNSKIFAIGAIGCTFILASIAWTFFRAVSINDACTLLMQVVKGDWVLDLAQLGITIKELYLSIILIIVIIIMDVVAERKPVADIVEAQISPIRWAIYLVLLFVLILFGMYGSLAADSFIYVSF